MMAVLDLLQLCISESIKKSPEDGNCRLLKIKIKMEKRNLNLL